MNDSNSWEWWSSLNKYLPISLEWLPYTYSALDQAKERHINQLDYVWRNNHKNVKIKKKKKTIDTRMIRKYARERNWFQIGTISQGCRSDGNFSSVSYLVNRLNHSARVSETHIEFHIAIYIFFFSPHFPEEHLFLNLYSGIHIYSVVHSLLLPSRTYFFFGTCAVRYVSCFCFERSAM